MVKVSLKFIAKNAFEIRLDDVRLLNSYDKIIGLYKDRKYYISEIYYSTTSEKHIKLWLNETLCPIVKVSQVALDDIYIEGF
jgi:hypothetical protein